MEKTENKNTNQSKVNYKMVLFANGKKKCKHDRVNIIS